jgi:hypothetical protein
MIKIGAIPWQVWAGAAALAAMLLLGRHIYNEGWSDAVAKAEQKQRAAADAAQKQVDRVKSGDRSGVVQFDRD